MGSNLLLTHVGKKKWIPDLSSIPEYAPGGPAGIRCQAVGGHHPFKDTFDLGIIPTSCACGIIQLTSFSSLHS